MVKESVFPFKRFPGVDTLLGQRCDRQVKRWGLIYGWKSVFKISNGSWPSYSEDRPVFISVKDSDKDKILPIAQLILDMGFSILATKGTHKFLEIKILNAQVVFKVNEGRPNVLDALKNNDIQMVINSPSSGDVSI